MPTLVLRFLGRFAYAIAHSENDVTGEISVIAPAFGHPFKPHQPMMAIPRHAIALGKDLTTKEPTFKTLSDVPDALAAEMFVWNLSGLNVRFVADSNRGQTPSATLGLEEPDRVIPDLAALSTQVGSPAPFDPSTLSASKNGKTLAVIHVTEGDGIAKMVSLVDNAFLVELQQAKQHPQPNPQQLNRLVSTSHNRRAVDGTFASFKKADVVEFAINIERNVPFTFTLSDGPDAAEGTQRVSVLSKESDARVMVNFSNLCAALPVEEFYDLEFEQYYNLLKQKHGDKALIPMPTDEGGEPGDCQTQARIDFVKST